MPVCKHSFWIGHPISDVSRDPIGPSFGINAVTKKIDDPFPKHQTSWPPTFENALNINRQKELWIEKLAATWPPTLYLPENIQASKFFHFPPLANTNVIPISKKLTYVNLSNWKVLVVWEGR